MPQQLLHNFDVLSVGFEESCEGAPEGVPGDPLGYAEPLDHRLDVIAHDGLQP